MESVLYTGNWNKLLRIINKKNKFTSVWLTGCNRISVSFLSYLYLQHTVLLAQSSGYANFETNSWQLSVTVIPSHHLTQVVFVVIKIRKCYIEILCTDVVRSFFRKLHSQWRHALIIIALVFYDWALHFVSGFLQWRT